MIYTIIISLLIEKPFYLLRPQSVSFQIDVRVYRYICEIFLLYVAFFDSLLCPEGRVFVHNDCPGGRVFAPFKSCPGGRGWFWMKLIPALTGEPKRR